MTSFSVCANPAGALEEFLEEPERLKDLDAFAEELEQQGFGKKSITLYDIRTELNCRYKDLRTPTSPKSEELYVNKGEPRYILYRQNYYIYFIRYYKKKTSRDQLDQGNPVRNDKARLWQCPFCLKNDFPELSEVWTHLNAGAYAWTSY